MADWPRLATRAGKGGAAGSIGEAQEGPGEVQEVGTQSLVIEFSNEWVGDRTSDRARGHRHPDARLGTFLIPDQNSIQTLHELLERSLLGEEPDDNGS